MNRQDLISEYASEMVESFDIYTVYTYALEKMRADLAELSDEELIKEVTEYFPHLLEN